MPRSPSVQIHIHFPYELYTKVISFVEKERTSVSAYIRSLVIHDLRERGELD